MQGSLHTIEDHGIAGERNECRGVLPFRYGIADLDATTSPGYR